MQLSVLLSTLALSTAAVSARRDLRHVGPVGERLQAHRRHPEPQAENEYASQIRRTSSSSGYQYLTNTSQSESRPARQVLPLPSKS